MDPKGMYVCMWMHKMCVLHILFYIIMHMCTRDCHKQTLLVRMSSQIINYTLCTCMSSHKCISADLNYHVCM